VEGVTIMALGLTDDRQLEVADETVVAFEARDRIWEMLAHTGPIRRIGEASPEVGDLIVGARVLDVGEQLPALPHPVEAPAEEVACGPHRRRIDIRLRQQASSQQARDLA
jgi:hypothetical protein